MIRKVEEYGQDPAFVADFVPVLSRRGLWRVILSWDGDGIWGKYSAEPEDEDRQMLRVRAERDGKIVVDGVTYLRATDPRVELQKAADLALARCVANAKRPDPLFMRKLCYLHLGRRGPAIEVPIDSKCES